MKYLDWDPLKNEKLKEERGISFEEAVIAIEEKRVLTILEHPNKGKYPNQKVAVIEIEGYAYAVPYVEDDEKIFLKTIIPSRKLTRQYIMKKENL